MAPDLIAVIIFYVMFLGSFVAVFYKIKPEPFWRLFRIKFIILRLVDNSLNTTEKPFKLKSKFIQHGYLSEDRTHARVFQGQTPTSYKHGRIPVYEYHKDSLYPYHYAGNPHFLVKPNHPKAEGKEIHYSPETLKAFIDDKSLDNFIRTQKKLRNVDIAFIIGLVVTLIAIGIVSFQIIDLKNLLIGG